MNENPKLIVTHLITIDMGVMHVVGNRDSVVYEWTFAMNHARPAHFTVMSLSGEQVPFDINPNRIVAVESDHEYGAEPPLAPNLSGLVQGSDGIDVVML